MEILLVLLLVAGATVLPVMFAARLFSAQNTGFGRALLAVIMQAGVSQGVSMLAIPLAASALLGLLAAGLMYAAVLGTSFGKGILIGIVAGLLGFVVLVLGLPLLGIDPGEVAAG